MKQARILIVEDEPALLEALKLIVGSNHEVITAEDGEEALLKAQNEKPNLILLDIFLPKLDGFQVLEKLKGDKKLAKLPVVVLSNCAGDADKKKAKELGALDFWVKADLDLGQIDRLVVGALGGHSANS